MADDKHHRAPLHPLDVHASREMDREADSTLLARLRTGDDDAHRALFDVYYDPLIDFLHLYVANRLGRDISDPVVSEIASESVHDVLLAVWRRRHDLTVTTTLRQYLFGAARNRAMSGLRALSRARHQEAAVLQGLDVEQSAPSSDADDTEEEYVIDRPADWAALRAAVNDLAPGRRLILLLRWWEGLSFAEIASLLEISVRSAETQHLRAMRDLRARMKSTKLGS